MDWSKNLFKHPRTPAMSGDNANSQPTSTMATSSIPREEVKPVIPIFSYAQAAKGKTAPSQTSSAASKAPSDTSASSVKNGPVSEATAASSDVKQPEGRQNKSEAIAKPEIFQKSTRASRKDAALHDQNETNAPQDTTEDSPAGGAHENGSIEPPSQERSRSAASTDEKALANGVGESGSDKTVSNATVSDQSSDKEKASEPSDSGWEETKPAAFKEAPLPPVNVWAQRMAQGSKAKPLNGSAIQPAKQSNAGNGSSNISLDDSKSNEVAGDHRKPDPRRRVKNGVEDRLPPKDGARALDGKSRSHESSYI